MIKNVQSLIDKSKNVAKENNLSVQQVLQHYMFERFLERLSKSEYVDKFIIKGGLLVSSIIGINMRTTMDIDTYDLYFFANLKWNEVDKKVLKQAILTTFNHRKSDYELENAESILEEIKSSEPLIQLWKEYQKKKTYAKDINFENVIIAINKILKEIE